MRLQKLALVGVAALALSIPAAANAGTGWYLGLGAGWDHLEKTRISHVAPAFAATVDSKDSALLTGTVGYKFDNGFRIEEEIGWVSHAADHYTRTIPAPGVFVANGHQAVTSILANFVYDIPLGDTWALSLGGGLGAAAVRENLIQGGSNVALGRKWAFQWQGIAGLSYNVTDSTDLFLDFRYRSTNVDSSFFASAPLNPMDVHSLHSEAVMIGVRWYFEEEAPPPPPYIPPPPPPPPPPPVKTFIVFFDFDKSNLTAEAQSVVSEAVKTAQSTGMVRVMVTGHTDTVGSDGYNQALSERRAESVKDEMVRQGMTGDSISIQGKSFHDPLVPTGPGVREPQNRRAVIDLGN